MSPPVQILGGTCPPCPIGIDAPGVVSVIRFANFNKIRMWLCLRLFVYLFRAWSLTLLCNIRGKTIFKNCSVLHYVPLYCTQSKSCKHIGTVLMVYWPYWFRRCILCVFLTWCQLFLYSDYFCAVCVVLSSVVSTSASDWLARQNSEMTIRCWVVAHIKLYWLGIIEWIMHISRICCVFWCTCDLSCLLFMWTFF